MNEEITRLKIQNELDVVLAYRKALQLCELTGLTVSAQTKFATAVSEISRNVLEHVGIGLIKFKVIDDEGFFVEAVVEDNGRGIPNAQELISSPKTHHKRKGSGILNAKRLVDDFFIETEKNQGTKVRLRKRIPSASSVLSKSTIKKWKEYFEVKIPISPYEEIKKQNLFLSEMMEVLRIKEIESEFQIEEIKRLNKDLDQFAYTVSHDLKAPLKNIDGLITIVEEDIKETNYFNAFKTIEMIKTQVIRMDKLIHDILDYSKSGRKNLAKTEVDTSKLIHEIIDTLVIPKRFKIHIETNCIVCTEEVYLFQIFTNLLTNAIKHHDKPEGIIVINCKEEKDFLKFSVSDDGPGISFENQSKIFKIFEGSNVPDIDSTGVGLAIVQKIINEKGGRIWVESDGRGAKFIFTWPY